MSGLVGKPEDQITKEVDQTQKKKRGRPRKNKEEKTDGKNRSDIRAFMSTNKEKEGFRKSKKIPRTPPKKHGAEQGIETEEHEQRKDNEEDSDSGMSDLEDTRKNQSEIDPEAEHDEENTNKKQEDLGNKEGRSGEQTVLQESHPTNGKVGNDASRRGIVSQAERIECDKEQLLDIIKKCTISLKKVTIRAMRYV